MVKININNHFIIIVDYFTVNSERARPGNEREGYDSDVSDYTPSENGVLNADYLEEVGTAECGKPNSPVTTSECEKPKSQVTTSEYEDPNATCKKPKPFGLVSYPSTSDCNTSPMANTTGKENEEVYARPKLKTKSNVRRNILKDLQFTATTVSEGGVTLQQPSGIGSKRDVRRNILKDEQFTGTAVLEGGKQGLSLPSPKRKQSHINVIQPEADVSKPTTEKVKQPSLRIGLPKPSLVDKTKQNKGDCSLEATRLTPYQAMRLKNLNQNDELLKSLGVQIPSNMTIEEREKDKKSSKVSAQIGNKKPRPLPRSEKKTPVKKLPSRQSRSVARKRLQDRISDGSSQSEQSSENESIGSFSFTDSSGSSEEDEDNDKRKPDRRAQPSKDRGIEGTRTISEEEEEDDPDETSDESTEDTAHEKMTKRAKLKQQKELRNSGKRHTTVKGKVVAARRRKPPHECKTNYCHKIVTPEIGDELFREYWNQSSHNKRVAYVASHVESKPVKRSRPRKHILNREKTAHNKYFLEIDGSRHQVCRKTFLGTLGETDRFVRNVVDNKSHSKSGITTDDRRGKKTPPHALSLTNKAEAINKHILSYPAYVSHYCRAKTGETKYLSSDLSVAEMYRQYTEDENNPTVSLSTYTQQFKKTGLKFHPPQTDGCDTCDTMDTAIKEAPAGSAERKSLEEKKDLHLRKAEKAYVLKKAAKLEAKSDPTKRVLVCDMQQCLPTPYLKCKRIYYSRQLYVLNYTVNDCSTGLTHHYMWTEVEGHRGSNEVSSCLLRHILENIPDGVEHLTVFSDCCSGQNRNSTMCMMFFIALQEHPSLKKIEHILLVPGHTFMAEVDTKHAIIEKHKKYIDKINIPEEWYSIVDKAGKGKFKVHHMEAFQDIAALAKDELVRRTVCTDKEPVQYMKNHWWQYEKASIGMVSVKANFNEAAPFRTLSFLRKGVRSDRVPRLLDCIEVLPGNVPISEAKKKDLINLLPYLSEEFHEYYRDLPASTAVVDIHPQARHVPDKSCNIE
ncbi:hypothetical protein FOCC_FOCC003566 [Frankliniella occidentalis]|nr:hypothetical protein FOCC_FOCC003566 [Frankliniella occidentalis]